MKYPCSIWNSVMNIEDKRWNCGSHNKSICAGEDIPEVTQVKDLNHHNIHCFITRHQYSCSLHLFEPTFFSVLLLYLPCCVFSLIDNWLLIRMFSIKCIIFVAVVPKYVISFKIKKQNIFYFIPDHWSVCISDKVCVFNVWRFQRWVDLLREKQNDVLGGIVNMDASPK